MRFWRREPALGKNEKFLFIFPMLVWIGLLVSRPYVLQARCQYDPSVCDLKWVPKIDWPVIHYRDPVAERYSFIAQDTAAVVGVMVPIGVYTAFIIGQHLSPPLALAAFVRDGVLLAQTVAWNGAIMEYFRVGFQRPRPFVYSDPKDAGRNGAHYTSFYSGHTSFVATAMMAIFLLVVRRMPKSRILIAAFGVFGIAMTAMTGLFRVFNARHFYTDVIFASGMGGAIAIAIVWLHSRSNSDQAKSAQ